MVWNSVANDLAHIVAQSDDSLAPRSLVDLPEHERELANNLLLACPTCHTDIEKRLQAKMLDVGWLLMIKKRHEHRIRRATTLAAMEKSVVLRLVGQIQGAATEIGPLEPCPPSWCRATATQTLRSTRTGRAQRSTFVAQQANRSQSTRAITRPRAVRSTW